MKLSGSEISKEVQNGRIYIENFVRERVNPNSYNLTLNEKLLVYTLDQFTHTLPIPMVGCAQDMFNANETEGHLDSAKENNTREIIIPDDGYILEPGILYLGKTNELTSTNFYVPGIDGRSSIGRLGIYIHVTAGFGDVGFKGRWTMEISCIHPVKVYKNMEICQIYFEPLQGDAKQLYHGKYQNSDDVVASKLYEEFEK